MLVATARVDEDLLQAAPRLRLVQHQGVGYDNIDVDACRRAAIPVALTPEGTTIGSGRAHGAPDPGALSAPAHGRCGGSPRRVAGLVHAQPQR